MKHLGSKILTATFLVFIILASGSISISAAQETGWQAQPLYRIKSSGINPDAYGSYNPYYSPTDIKQAYNLPPTGGSGTIAIIDAYDAPRISADLIAFSNQWGLAAANLEVHTMSSTVRGNQGWALEASLDVEWAHAIAPNAKILLV